MHLLPAPRILLTRADRQRQQDVAIVAVRGDLHLASERCADGMTGRTVMAFTDAARNPLLTAVGSIQSKEEQTDCAGRLLCDAPAAGLAQ
jgi:hypothetical protein